MAYQGEYFIERYGARAAESTPPVQKILASGVPTSAGTDATRVASYNPWVSLFWLVAGKTIGGTRLYPAANCLDRVTALRMWTEKSAWFSNEEGTKGRLEVGALGDLAVLDRDYFACAEDEIRDITSMLTVVGSRIVWGSGDFGKLAPDMPPAMPDWAPPRHVGGYQRRLGASPAYAAMCACSSPCAVHSHDHAKAWGSSVPASELRSFWGALGCSCYAF
jgi:hypothetical protein